MSDQPENGNKNTGYVKKPELLSPAGDLEGVKAAITAGADAVYLGASLFSARAYAKNLSDAELLEAIDFAHLFGRKVYLTSNILMRDQEIPQAVDMIGPLYERGLDGVIVQDIGLLSILRQVYPELPLHASTQMAVLSAQGAEWLKKNYGVSRVVPGRELSLKEIGAIIGSGIEVECFIHGAMCYSYSGRCLFSSIAGGRSGNRGRCAGPCRQRYTAEDGKSGYYLSMKDMCTIERIGELIDLGVTSFKIEGRMKASEYTAGVTAIYRKYIDHYLQSGSLTLEADDLKTLSSLYIRSKRQEGYLHTHNGRDMISVESPAYSETPEALKQKIREKYIDKFAKVPIELECSVAPGRELYLSAKCAGGSAECYGEVCQSAQKRATTKEEIEKQVRKTGGTDLTVTHCSVKTDGDSFVPVKALNELRRTVLEALKEQILMPERRNLPESGQKDAILAKTFGQKASEQASDHAGGKAFRFLAGVLTRDQAENALSHELICGLIVPLDLYTDNAERMCARASASAKKIYLRMPQILRQKDTERVRGLLDRVKDEDIGGIYCGSVDALALASRFFPKEKLIAEESLYVWNQAALGEVLRYAAGYTASAERNGKELGHAIRREAMELIVYGYQPLMYSAGCLQKTLKDCDPASGVHKLRDEKGHTFYVRPEHRYCFNTLYNCTPLSLHKQLPELLEKGIAGTYRFEFTMENKHEMGKILDGYAAILNGEGQEFPPGEYTQGHYKRGAE